MHSKHSTWNDHETLKAAAPAPERAPGLSSELGSALVEFARRLATFGLGEADRPLLDEFVERRRHPRLRV
jgi:hypothetical protein